MEAILNDFKKNYTSDHIEMQNPRLNKYTKDLDFIFVENGNISKDIIHKRVIETETIIIDHIKVSTSYYFTICLTKLLLIISDTELQFFASFINDQKKPVISLSRISFDLINKKNLNLTISIADQYFQDEVRNFSYAL